MNRKPPVSQKGQGGWFLSGFLRIDLHTIGVTGENIFSGNLRQYITLRWRKKKDENSFFQHETL